jgi:hypothetical protein
MKLTTYYFLASLLMSCLGVFYYKDDAMVYFSIGVGVASLLVAEIIKTLEKGKE